MSKFLIIAVLLCSSSAFAVCPAGTQGSSDFKEAQATVNRILGQHLVPNSTTIERATDNKPLKILFERKAGKIVVTLFRSTDGEKHLFNTVALGPDVAEVCGGGGEVVAIISGYEIHIAKAAGLLSITASGYGPYKFGSIAGGTEVAHADD